ncbi:MAG: maleylacetoacetate isomerase [Rhodanobacteraceae bacterium]
MSHTLKLYSYWRSSAAYRVRIALNLKGLAYDLVPVHLVQNAGEQHDASYHRLNPQELVPVLLDGRRVIHQSLAIIEYLDEATQGAAALLPTNPRARARARSLALLVACDIHPLGNLRVLQFLEREFQLPRDERERWSRHWITEGLRAFEELVADHPSTGTYCEGDAPTLADICLVPQVYNAQRYGVDLTPYPTIERICERCRALPAFDAARPERQPDAPEPG